MAEPKPLDHTFSAPIGVEVKGEVWSCVEMPGSAEFFGTKRAVRVDATVDDIPLQNVGLMVTGRGGHMVQVQEGSGAIQTLVLHTQLTGFCCS